MPNLGTYILFVNIISIFEPTVLDYVCVCPCHFKRFRDSNYFDCIKTMPKYKNDSIEGTQTQRRKLCRSTSGNFLTNLDT